MAEHLLWIHDDNVTFHTCFGVSIKKKDDPFQGGEN